MHSNSRTAVASRLRPARVDNEQNFQRSHFGISLPKWNLRVTRSTGVYIVQRPQARCDQVQIWCRPARHSDYKHGGRVQWDDIIGHVTCLKTAEGPGSDEC